MLEFAVPAVVIGGAIASFAVNRTREKKRESAMTPQRKAVYEAALMSLKDPKQLRKLADAFEQVGLEKEADILRKRAALRELPDNIVAGRKDAFRKAMSSLEPQKIIRTADAFSQVACFSAASNLRKYAAGLQSTDPAIIQNIIKDLEDNCSRDPSGQIRSVATRQATSNLRERISRLQTASGASGS
jgi:hypothetical protein